MTVGLGLTRDAATNPWGSPSPGFGDFLAAVLAVSEALAPVQSTPGAGDLIIDARIDLFLHGSIVSPTNSHVPILLGRSPLRRPHSLPRLAQLRQAGYTRAHHEAAPRLLLYGS